MSPANPRLPRLLRVFMARAATLAPLLVVGAFLAGCSPEPGTRNQPADVPSVRATSSSASGTPAPSPTRSARTREATPTATPLIPPSRNLHRNVRNPFVPR